MSCSCWRRWPSTGGWGCGSPRRATRARKRRLALAIAGNLGTLAVFKYANFGAANVNAIAPVFGVGPLA
jgi:hypothetical protein